jgi:hypothetical protein
VNGQQERFLDLVLRNEHSSLILNRACDLALPDWWLTGGALFQTVWNVLDGRDPIQGIRDYDLFYFDPEDLSSEAERDAQDRAASLFADAAVPVEVHNEARVHLWYEQDFGVPAAPFRSTCDAIDHFVAPTCCFGVTADSDGELKVYAPHGYDDLFHMRVRPNAVLAPPTAYEAKCSRWRQEWPSLTVEPWVATES